MFGLFKKPTKKEQLQKKYENLMKESYKLSHTDRQAADAKIAEADLVIKEIESLT